MAVFVRPAVWSYDLPLFRRAIADELELEGLLAATVIKEEAVWAVEANEEPVAFAWGRHEGGVLRLLRFYLAPHPAAEDAGHSLLARIAADAGGQFVDLAAITAELDASGSALATTGYGYPSRPCSQAA